MDIIREDHCMNKKQWYESLFENYGQKYDVENFTHGTIGECDFIEQKLKYNKALHIPATLEHEFRNI
jgi:hypothetical protein